MLHQSNLLMTKALSFVCYSAGDPLDLVEKSRVKRGKEKTQAHSLLQN